MDARQRTEIRLCYLYVFHDEAYLQDPSNVRFKGNYEQIS